MKTLSILNLPLLWSLLAAATAPVLAEDSATDVPREIPSIVRPFAFDQVKPESRYEGHDGGPGTNFDGRIYNSRTIEKHTLGIRYDNQRVALYFQRKDGKKLHCKIGTYQWPQHDGMVKTSVFVTENAKKILVCVGGVPAAVIFPDSLKAISISQKTPDGKLRWDSKMLRSFERIPKAKGNNGKDD